MLSEFRERLQKLALQPIAEVAQCLGSTVDMISPWNSPGVVVSNAAVFCDGDQEAESRVDDSFHSFTTEISERRAALIERASAEQLPLASSTIDDDEARCIRSLPRATLEALLLSASSTYQSFRTEMSACGVPHCFGSVLGPQFDSLVEVMRTKEASRISPQLLPTKQVVLREMVERSIPTDKIVAGDLLVVCPGDTLPCDAILVAIQSSSSHRGQAIVSISGSRLHSSSLRIERQVGHFRPCPFFGATSVLPQQCMLHNSSGASSGGLRCLAIAITPPALSSWITRQNRAVQETQSRQTEEPLAFRMLEQFPYFPSPFPAVHVFHRTALLKLARCDVIMIECGSILLDEASYVVTDALWSSSQYSSSTVDALWNCSDVLQQHHQSISSSLSSINDSQDRSVITALTSQRVRVQSFISDPKHPSRLPVVNSASGLRSLVVSMALATCYPVGVQDEGADLPSDTVRTFLMSDAHVVNHVLPNYRPVCNPTLIPIRGSVVTARLFEYSIPSAAADDTKRHVVLVMYGDANAVLNASSFASTCQGQLRVSSEMKSMNDRFRTDVVCSPNFLFGVATADILMDLVGTKLAPSPSDLSALLAQTTSLCYQGALVCQVVLRPQCVRAIRTLTNKLGKRVCLVSFARSPARLATILNRVGAMMFSDGTAASSSTPRVISPDIMHRWVHETPPSSASFFGLSAVGWDPMTLLPMFMQWCTQGGESSSAVAYCGATCAALVGLRMANVGVMASVGDPVADAVLRSAAEVRVNDMAFDDLAEAMVTATDFLASSGVKSV